MMKMNDEASCERWREIIMIIKKLVIIMGLSSVHRIVISVRDLFIRGYN